jgi:hypothetical protein
MKRAQITEEIAYGNALDRLTGVEKPVNASPKREPSKPPEPPGVTTIKLSVFLNRGEDAYLEGLGSTAKFTGGKKLSKPRKICSKE